MCDDAINRLVARVRNGWRSYEVLEAEDGEKALLTFAATADIGFNLIVCLYALGEKEKMRTWFERLLMIDIPGIDEEEQEELA